MPLPLFLILASVFTLPAVAQEAGQYAQGKQRCKPPTEAFMQKIYDHYDQNSKSLRKFSAAKDLLNDMGKCLKDYVKNRREACEDPGDEVWDSPPQNTNAKGGHSDGGCLYLTNMTSLTFAAAKEIRDIQRVHLQNSRTLSNCLVIAEQKLRMIMMKPTPKEAKTLSKDLPKAKAEIDKLALARKALEKGEEAESSKLEGAAQEAVKKYDVLDKRAKNACKGEIEI